MYRNRITTTKYINGSGNSFEHAIYSEIEVISKENMDWNWSAQEFALHISKDMDDDGLKKWADDSIEDILYECTLLDDDGKCVVRIEIWQSDIAKWRLEPNNSLNIKRELRVAHGDDCSEYDVIE